MNNCLRFFLIASVGTLLSACSAMTGLKNDLADLQTKQSVTTLPNGKKVHFNVNLSPTRDWGCRQIGRPQSYNWAKLQTEAQFHFKVPYLFLIDKGVDYLVNNNLTANYINAQIPKERTFSFSNSSRTTDYTRLNPGAMATLRFYQCTRINPKHELGVTRHTDVGVRVGTGAKNSDF